MKEIEEKCRNKRMARIKEKRRNNGKKDRNEDDEKTLKN